MLRDPRVRGACWHLPRACPWGIVVLGSPCTLGRRTGVGAVPSCDAASPLSLELPSLPSRAGPVARGLWEREEEGDPVPALPGAVLGKQRTGVPGAGTSRGREEPEGASQAPGGFAPWVGAGSAFYVLYSHLSDPKNHEK